MSDDWSVEDSNHHYHRWLIAGYKYYIQDDGSYMSDYDYDFLAHLLLKNWDKVTHPAKALINEDSLRCGSAFHIREDQYPEEVRKFCVDGPMPVHDPLL